MLQAMKWIESIDWVIVSRMSDASVSKLETFHGSFPLPAPTLILFCQEFCLYAHASTKGNGRLFDAGCFYILQR